MSLIGVAYWVGGAFLPEQCLCLSDLAQGRGGDVGRTRDAHCQRSGDDRATAVTLQDADVGGEAVVEGVIQNLCDAVDAGDDAAAEACGRSCLADRAPTTGSAVPVMLTERLNGTRTLLFSKRYFALSSMLMIE